MAGQRRKLPWEEMRLRYISDSTLSLRGLAGEYGIDYRNVQRRYKREGWKAQREAFLDDVFERAKEQASKNLAAIVPRNMAEGLTELRTLRSRIMERAQKRLADDAAPELSEDVVIATQSADGRVVRKVTKRKSMPVDLKAVAAVIAAEASMLKIALVAGLDRDGLIREIVIT